MSDFEKDIFENEDEMDQTTAPDTDEIPVTDVSDDEAESLLSDKDENPLIVKFKKPFEFEGEIYTEVDLSGLEKLTGRNTRAIEKAFARTGVVSTTPELTSTYAQIVAVAATGYPAEFFDELPITEIRKIKTAITGFLFNED